MSDQLHGGPLFVFELSMKYHLNLEALLSFISFTKVPLVLLSCT